MLISETGSNLKMISPNIDDRIGSEFIRIDLRLMLCSFNKYRISSIFFKSISPNKISFIMRDNWNRKCFQGFSFQRSGAYFKLQIEFIDFYQRFSYSLITNKYFRDKFEKNINFL